MYKLFFKCDPYVRNSRDLFHKWILGISQLFYMPDPLLPTWQQKSCSIFSALKYWIADLINFVWLYHIVTPGLFYHNEYGNKIFSFQCTRTSHLLLFLIFLPLPFKLEGSPLPWKCVSFSVGLQSPSKSKAGCSNPALSFFF